MSGEINWSDVNAERGTILTTIGDALPKETPEEKEERLKREAAADAKAKQQIAQNGSRHGNVPDPKRPRNKGQDEKKKSH
ncbi:hypothetical protein L207DRAFT_516186 [Hyaloscypha variabilis F]|uniref:Uncharacterized protein n=1 Tax=Hyaloscypha variabilis (strain UAMH 11265 / GT02V1 / F) TaxID=1149755 RepID=A0A2J6R9R8_HYAVF|nr:hypothetical protein L207DRAFT_516186 [Hyaloscypha variabilis F]